MPAKIFISYRRADASASASNLQTRLERIFERKNVFMDVDNLLAGQRFDEELNKALQDCDVLLAVIGPNWMDILSARLAAGAQDPDQRDYVREEIATALERNIVVIPVLVDVATLPSRSALPGDIQDLVLYQKHEIAHDRFGRDVEDLAAAIRTVHRGRKPPARWRTIAAAVIAVALIGAGGIWLYNAYVEWRQQQQAAQEAARQAEAERQRQAKLKAEAERKRKAEEAARQAEAERRRHAELTRPGREFRDCPECPEMVVVPAGSFRMGSPSSEKGREDDEGPQRRVTIAAPFAVGKFEVTWDEWEACVADKGCDSSGPQKPGGDEDWGKGRRPVINVSWNDAKAYVAWLSGKTGNGYRLPREAEWEYAARAGTTTRWSFDGDEGELCKYANHADRQSSFLWKNEKCSDGVGNKTAKVGQYRANPWGLHDMHGNVREWVEDCYVNTYRGAPADGTAQQVANCSSRVLRGGSWNDNPRILRSAYRSRSSADLRGDDDGFRVARTLPPKS